MERSILEKQLAIESELVRGESMSVLKELEDIDYVCFNCNSFDDIESTKEHTNCD